jgi:hypothetical protein
MHEHSFPTRRSSDLIPTPDSISAKNDNFKAKLSDDSDGIMGGGELPDPHPA